MQSIDYWRLCDDFTVFQAALLIVGEDPSEWQYVETISVDRRPAGYDAAIYNATGGYLVVKDDGEILCYHVYNINEFQDYLFNNTRLDTPDPNKFDFGYIYSENGKNYIKLNLLIRF